MYRLHEAKQTQSLSGDVTNKKVNAEGKSERAEEGRVRWTQVRKHIVNYTKITTKEKLILEPP